MFISKSDSIENRSTVYCLGCSNVIGKNDIAPYDNLSVYIIYKNIRSVPYRDRCRLGRYPKKFHAVKGPIDCPNHPLFH